MAPMLGRPRVVHIWITGANLLRRCAVALLSLFAAKALVWAGPQAGAKAAPPAEPKALREQVRALAKPHCGKCHLGSLPTAKPAALAVFDLDQPVWPSRMEGAQLAAFIGRIKGKLDPAGMDLVRAFVAAERAAARASGRPDRRP